MGEIEGQMIKEIVLEMSNTIKFSKVIDCKRENEYHALLLIKINEEKTKTLDFYTADHMIYEEEYYEKLIEYLKNTTIGIHRITSE